jgi:hypothetical protein
LWCDFEKFLFSEEMDVIIVMDVFKEFTVTDITAALSMCVIFYVISYEKFADSGIHLFFFFFCLFEIFCSKHKEGPPPSQSCSASTFIMLILDEARSTGKKEAAYSAEV